MNPRRRRHQRNRRTMRKWIGKRCVPDLHALACVPVSMVVGRAVFYVTTMRAFFFLTEPFIQQVEFVPVRLKEIVFPAVSPRSFKMWEYEIKAIAPTKHEYNLKDAARLWAKKESS